MLEIEIGFLKLKSVRRQVYHRFVRNGFINGRPTPFLVVKIVPQSSHKTSINGLSNLYIAYTSFIGEEITFTNANRILIDDKESEMYIYSLRLTDYTQDPTVDWGTFKCMYYYD